MKNAFAVLLALGAMGPLQARAVVFESDLYRLEVAADGTLRSLASKPEARDYADLATPCPVAVIYRGGRSVPLAEGPHAAVVGRWEYRGGERFAASAVTLDGDALTIEFGPARVKAACRVRRGEGYLAFELTGVEGGPVDRIEFLRLSLRKLPKLGQWVNLAADDHMGLCLCGGNVATNVECLPGERNVLMTAAAEAAVGFKGPTAVLLACREPGRQFLDAMARVESDFDLPAGASFRRSPLQRLSYLWARQPTPDNIQEYIDLARRGGFRMLLFSYRAFSDAPGHFAWNKHYPRGMADLERVTRAIRAAGLKHGLHIHYSKAGKADAYVTPVPDDRLHVERTFTLAADVTTDATTLLVQENPDGATLDRGRRLLKLGHELVEYEEYSRKAPFQFTGCRRAALGTSAVAHEKGLLAKLLDVDTWPAFIRLDQSSDIQDEVARRIAEIYRRTGPYDMVYFDGAEDVHEPFWYNVANAQYRVFRLLDPPPPVCESAHYTHFSWHMISRSNAYDTVAPPDGMKDFCRLMPCPTAAERTKDFSRIQFGWLGRLGQAGPDVFEYIASRAAAWDCPIALHANLEDLRANPRADDCLAAMKIWEDARLGNHLSAADRRRLQNVRPEDAHYVSCYEQRGTFEKIRTNGDLTRAQRRILADRREHHLFLNEDGRYELVEIEEVPAVAKGAVKAYLFRRATHPADTYVLAWAVKGEVRLRLPRSDVVATRPFARRLSRDDPSSVTIGSRTYLLLSNTTPAAARELLRESLATEK